MLGPYIPFRRESMHSVAVASVISQGWSLAVLRMTLNMDCGREQGGYEHVNAVHIGMRFILPGVLVIQFELFD
jgi:hypothetical protein